MDFKKIGIVLFLIFFLLPINELGAQSSKAGFVPGNIWYSLDPFSEGDKIKIYTLIFNPDSRELSGTVIFFDNNVFLGKKDFVAPAKGVKDVSIDWTATVGTHSIFGKIENAKFLVSKGKYEEVYLAENETSKSSRTVSKKIIAKNIDTTDPNMTSDSKIFSSGLESVKNIGEFVAEKTPEFIAKPIISTANLVEGLRSDASTASKNKKGEIQKEIKTLKDTEIGKFLKPFKYTEFFLLTLFSFILNNKFMFYGILVIVIFLVIRYIWRFFFF